MARRTLQEVQAELTVQELEDEGKMLEDVKQELRSTMSQLMNEERMLCDMLHAAGGSHDHDVQEEVSAQLFGEEALMNTSVGDAILDELVRGAPFRDEHDDEGDDTLGEHVRSQLLSLTHMHGSARTVPIGSDHVMSQ